jgi:hypothetical protein
VEMAPTARPKAGDKKAEASAAQGASAPVNAVEATAR